MSKVYILTDLEKEELLYLMKQKSYGAAVRLLGQLKEVLDYTLK